jgi:hypothetical protein
MVLGASARVADSERMTLNFLTKRRPTTECDHTAQMRLEIAGMSRSVCESCGKVSVGYVEDHYGPERVQELAPLLGADDTDD